MARSGTVSDGPCRFYATGQGCRFGAKCKFSHEASSSTSRQERFKSHSKPNSFEEESPDLKKWHALLTRSKFSDLSPRDMEQFFTLGASLISQEDTGTLQKMIVLLAEDHGLKIVRQMVERSIANTHSSSTRLAVWQGQVKPLFQIISNPLVADSAILEEPSAAIRNFLIGIGGRRFGELYDFLLNTLEEVVSCSASAESHHTDVECAAAVLSLLIDSNTSNIVNEKFAPIVRRLASLAQSCGDQEMFSLLQTRKYIEYVWRRLETGQSIPFLGANRAADVPSTSRANFILQHDLPGQLSRQGPRHDNDHASISDVKILPTSDEILSPRSEYWPTTNPDQSHVAGVQWLLDRSFRLLREDTIGQLRDVARAKLESMIASGNIERKTKERILKTHTYPDVKLRELRFDAQHGLRLVIQFRQPQSQLTSPAARKDWWQTCRRLQPDALVCILNASRSAQFCTVVDMQRHRGPLIKDKDKDNDKPEPTLWEDDVWAYVSLKLLALGESSLEWAASWYRTQDIHALVEFPGVLLPAFEPTLKALQGMSQKLMLPFVDLLVPNGAGGQIREVPPPEYARRPGFRFNLKCLTTVAVDFWYSPLDVPNHQALSRASSLDPTQALALLNSLRRCMSLTEGPPGTGKSYTGGALIRVLIQNKEAAQLGPIICVTYTNHALDQVLEHLHKDGVKNIIRIGSRSQSETLTKVNLREVAREEIRTKHEKATLWKSFEDMEAAADRVQGSIAKLGRAKNAKAVKEHLEKYRPDYHETIFGASEDEEGYQKVLPNHSDALRRWTSAGVRSPIQRSLDECQEASLLSLSFEERSSLLDSWIREIQQVHISTIQQAREDWATAKQNQNAVHEEINARCLRQADVIGITTSGMAKNMDLLRKVHPKALICEEAGEVLEAHLLTALLPTIQHAILIGDHLQLRPQIANYDLQGTHGRGRQYSLDVSLFERLVKPFRERDGPLPYTILQTQRRMHPSISALIRPTMYPDLEDDESVEIYPDVPGMRNRLFWFHHSNSEKGRDSQAGLEMSHSNPFEVEMVAAVVSHLVRQGAYEAGEIAVLTPYMSQFKQLKGRLGSIMEVSMNERDQADLDADELEQAELQPGLTTTKARLSQTVRIATIDNFQGEEAKVVVMSLVRSNEERKVGFLKTENRINVLLSRAQHGMIIIGDAETAASVPMWDQVIEILKQENNFGTQLPLRCPRHLDTIICASDPDDFLRFAPDGGCNLPCKMRLSCGHACTGRCHSDIVHHAVKCLEPCQRRRQGCDHDCLRACGDSCDSKCKVMVKALSLTLLCGHTISEAVCWRMQDPSTISCRVMVSKIVPGCGHEVEVQCCTDVTRQSWVCQALCGDISQCGHVCKRKCYFCKEKDGGKVGKIDHGKCQQTCGRSYSACRHACGEPCHEGSDCKPCSAPCDVRCSHSRCPRPCNEPCSPCAEAECASQCSHRACSMPCAAPCDHIPCSRRCEKILDCGHQCPTLCGETCPQVKYCQTCADEDTKAAIVDVLEMKTYAEMNLDETPCIFADCGHFFTAETLDGLMSMQEFYDTSEDGIPIAIKRPSQPFSVEKVPVCPNCRGSLRCLSRYGRIVRRGLLDEATRKFIAWSTTASGALGQMFISEQEKHLERKESVTHWEKYLVGDMTLERSADSQIKAIKVSPARAYLDGLLHVRRKIRTHLERVKQEEQPFQRVSDMVKYNRKHREAKGDFPLEESMIQMKSYMQTLSLLLRCDLTILAEVAELCSKGGRDRTLVVDLSSHRNDASILTELGQSTQRPYPVIEGYIYAATASVIERIFLLQATESTEEAKGRGDVLKQQATDYLSQARETLIVSPSAAALATEIDAVEKMLRTSSIYEPVSLEEKKAIFAAMQKEFISTGHWYTCPAGHYFTIGECGMAMQTRNCPDCGAPIGGQHHQAADGVRRAHDMEELADDMARVRV